MPAVYTLSPLRFRTPESNGGVFTENDMFSGINYYQQASELISSDVYSSVLSGSFDVYSSFNSPRLARYIPSTESFFSRFYKGIYIYNPSKEKDGVLHESARRNIIFSITGGTTILLESPVNEQTLFYENKKYIEDFNDTINLYKVDKTSANNNVFISLSGMPEKNSNLPYFNLDGSVARSESNNVVFRDYVSANSGILIPELLPGEYYGVFLRVDIKFDVESKPVDYSFLNLTYENFNPIESEEDFIFGDRDVIPGFSTGAYRYFIQSFGLKFNTNLSSIKRDINKKINILYDNYPPFFSDYREAD
jgi:hypothetical protein